MGLYDREYAQQGSQSFEQSNTRGDSQIITFVKETYKLFAASMMAGAVGAYVGVPMADTIASMFFPLFILEIGLLIGLHFVKHKPGINLLVMFSFVFMTGLMLAPLLARTLGMSGGGAIIGNAFAMTSLIFGAMSFYAIKTKTDFTTYTKPLMIALVVIVVFSVINMFMGSPLLAIGLSAAVVLLFSVLIVYDTQNIIAGAYETPIDGAIALYLDFLNIFTALLQLFGIFGNRDD
ncbi:MAG: BAX inhibitor (BI)-1/YccA family protein [Helicobacteraceae bacterium]|nr:BAX inhibitor (BI)-1/YccA family protein [Helicobacteraceae bacterium]